MSLEIEGTVTLEGPGQSALTLRGEGRHLVVSVPNVRQARSLLKLVEIRKLLKAGPALLGLLVRTGLHVRVQVGKKTILTSRLFDRFRRQT